MTVGSISTSIRQRLLWPCLAGLTYFGLAWAMIGLTAKGAGVATIWPGNAVLLAMVLHRPRNQWWSLLSAAFVGNALANVLTRGSVLGPFLFGIANMGEVLIVALAVHRAVDRDSLLQRTPIMLRFLLWAGLIAPLASGLCGAFTVWALFDQPFWLGLLTWYLADALGMLVFAPFMFALIGGQFRRYLVEKTVAERWEVFGLLLLTTLLALFAFSRHYPILFLVYTPVIFVTFRLGWQGAKMAVMIIAIMGGILIMGELGPIPLLFADRLVQTFCFQLFLGILLLTTYPIASSLEARRRLMRELEESESSLRMLADQSPILLMSYDREGVCRRAMGATESLLGCDAASLVGRSLGEVKTDGFLRLRDAHERALAYPDQTHMVEFLTHAAGDKWLEASCRVTRDDHGHAVGTLATLHDITERKQQELHLERSAHTDSLTGALNRAGFLARLERVLENATDRALSLAMIDVDRFKLINDHSGHVAGDQVLREIADRIAAEVRAGDAIGRLGGDEFVLLLETPDWEKAQEICERVVAAVDGTEIGLPTGRMLKAAISCGVARYRAGQSADELIHAADLALYEAKRAGRNRMVSSDGEATAIHCPS